LKTCKTTRFWDLPLDFPPPSGRKTHLTVRFLDSPSMKIHYESLPPGRTPPLAGSPILRRKYISRVECLTLPPPESRLKLSREHLLLPPPVNPWSTPQHKVVPSQVPVIRTVHFSLGEPPFEKTPPVSQYGGYCALPSFSSPPFFDETPLRTSYFSVFCSFVMNDANIAKRTNYLSVHLYVHAFFAQY